MSALNTIEAQPTQAIESSSTPNANLLNQQLFEMQSAFGYRTNQEMLDCHFGGDVRAMINAVGNKEVVHVN